MDMQVVLEKAKDFLKYYWYTLVIAILLVAIGGWAWAKISRQHKLLRAAQERISWQTTQLRSKDLHISQLQNAVLIEKEKNKDRASAARIKELEKKNKGLQEERKTIDKETKKKQDAVGKMSLEELNKKINEE